MNKRNIIACLVGGIIIFIWQFMSNVLLPIQKPVQLYTSAQDTIMSVIKANISETGTYLLPNASPSMPKTEADAYMQSNVGKPWALVHYIKDTNFNMGLNMFRGVIADIVAMLLLVLWVLPNFKEVNIRNTVLACLGMSLCIYFTTSYADNIWYSKNTIPSLIDAICTWIPAGAWLGYYLHRS
jgi:hypothetical protein